MAQIAGPDTAMCDAIHCNDLSAVEILLRDGADINKAHRGGTGPLRLAATNGNAQMVKLMLQHGANIRETSDCGSTALHDAACCGYLDVVKVLLEHGASVRTRNQDQETALHHAAWAGQLQVVEVLLKHGADVDITCAKGRSAMYFAAEKGRERVMLALWHAGASLNKEDHLGITPMSFLQRGSALAKKIGALRMPPTSPRPEDAQSTLTEIQELWLRMRNSAVKSQELLTAIKAKHITCFSEFVLAHNLLLLAKRQGVLTRSQLASFGGSRDYLLENVYLPVFDLELDNERKAWFFRMLALAKRMNFIRPTTSLFDKVFQLRSDICHRRLDIQPSLTWIAREISSLQRPLQTLRDGLDQAGNNFEGLVEGDQQELSDLKNLASSLQQLRLVVQQKNRNLTMAVLAGVCLSLVPVLGCVISGDPFANDEVAFLLSQGEAITGTAIQAEETLAVNFCNFRNASFLTTDEYISKLNLRARQRLKAVVKRTEFKKIFKLQQFLTTAVKELQVSRPSKELEEEEIEAELHQRYHILASRSASTDNSISAQDAILELQHVLQLRINRSTCETRIDENVIEDVVMDRMIALTGRVDQNAFLNAYHVLETMRDAASKNDCEPV